MRLYTSDSRFCRGKGCHGRESALQGSAAYGEFVEFGLHAQGSVDDPMYFLIDHFIDYVWTSFAYLEHFFHLNALSSPILTKVHFDVILTMVADTIYTMLAHKLRGFEDCDAPKLYRHFVRGKGTVTVKDGRIHVTYPRRAHNPILRAVLWQRLPSSLPGLQGAEVILKFS